MQLPRTLALSLALVVAPALVACGKSDTPKKKAGPPPKDPCGKSVDRMIRCVGNDDAEFGKRLSKRRKDMIDKCEEFEPSKKKAIRCVQHTGCKPFLKCLSE